MNGARKNLLLPPWTRKKESHHLRFNIRAPLSVNMTYPLVTEQKVQLYFHNSYTVYIVQIKTHKISYRQKKQCCIL